MIKIKISDEQRARGKELYEFNVLKGSVTKGEGNEVGALGEIIVMDYYGDKAEYVGDYDYDLIIKNKKVDVKTKKQNVPPQLHHTYNIFSYNTKQKCDWYCFVVIHKSLRTGWIVGWKNKEEFFKEATFRREGEVDDTIKGCEWKFKGDCYCLKITDLDLHNKE
jgi:hypothetical protein